MDDGLERMVSALQQTGRFEVLRRFEPPARYSPPDGSALSTAVAVDVETTGRDNQHDHILQFSAVPFDPVRPGLYWGSAARAVARAQTVVTVVPGLSAR